MDVRQRVWCASRNLNTHATRKPDDLSPLLFGSGPSPRDSVWFYGLQSRLNAARYKNYKAHWTTSGWGGSSVQLCGKKQVVVHDPPLLFDLAKDAGETQPIDPASNVRAGECHLRTVSKQTHTRAHHQEYRQALAQIQSVVAAHDCYNTSSSCAVPSQLSANNKNAMVLLLLLCCPPLLSATVAYTHVAPPSPGRLCHSIPGRHTMNRHPQRCHQVSLLQMHTTAASCVQSSTWRPVSAPCPSFPTRMSCLQPSTIYSLTRSCDKHSGVVCCCGYINIVLYSKSAAGICCVAVSSLAVLSTTRLVARGLLMDAATLAAGVRGSCRKIGDPDCIAAVAGDTAGTATSCSCVGAAEPVDAVICTFSNVNALGRWRGLVPAPEVGDRGDVDDSRLVALELRPPGDEVGDLEATRRCWGTTVWPRRNLRQHRNRRRKRCRLQPHSLASPSPTQSTPHSSATACKLACEAQDTTC